MDVGDPQGLALSTYVNGELRQSNSTRNMIHDVRTLVSGKTAISLTAIWSGIGIKQGAPAGFVDLGAISVTA